MTVNNKAPVTGPTLSDGVKIDWPFDFKITAASQMTLIVRDMVTLNDETVTTGFTIDAAYIDSDTGGYVRYQPGGNPLPAGKGVFAVREVPYTQPFRIGNQGAFWPQTHEKALDDIVMQVQQVVEALGRTARLPIGATNEDLEELLADVVRLAASADNIDIVAGVAGSLPTVAGIAPQIVAVAAIAASIVTVAAISGPISVVASLDDEIIALYAVRASIAVLGPISGDIETVASIAPAVSTVAGIAANVTTVAGIAANVTTVAGIAANVTTVAGIAANVTTVANNAAAVVDVSENMAAVQAAVASAEKAYQWAENPEDVPVEPGEFSAHHWAQKAAETVAAGVADGSVTLVKLAPDVVELIESNMRYLVAGSPLPSENIGPIWHEDYGGVLTWNTFNANGANYTGYASEQIGMVAFDGQATARRGWVKRNGASLSKVDFAALWNYALHVGRVVSLGTWADGAHVFADNGDGTFKLPNTRGRFMREAADGFSLDSGRVFGSSQADDVKQHTHPGTGLTFAGNALPGHAHSNDRASGGGTSLYGANYKFGNDNSLGTVGTTSVSAGTPSGTIGGNTGNNTGTETRGFNTAYLGVIKF